MKKITIYFSLLILFSIILYGEEYKILYLGKEPVTYSEIGIGGQITSDRITKISEIIVIGEIIANNKGKIKNIKIMENEFSPLFENIIDSNMKVDINKFKTDLEIKKINYNDFIKAYGGVSFLMIIPLEYDVSKSEIENYIKYLQSSGYRLVIFDLKSYNRYITLNDDDKIKDIKAKIFSDIFIHTD
ncbi:MAG: hypothetical protein KBF12_10965 [Sebaldella sp.]|nr:hypothetical protein [Sebaldella sp.]